MAEACSTLCRDEAWATQGAEPLVSLRKVLVPLSPGLFQRNLQTFSCWTPSYLLNQPDKTALPEHLVQYKSDGTSPGQACV